MIPKTNHCSLEEERCDMQKSLEVQRLRAAGVALERRLSQLDASRDRDGGVPAPFTPSSDRPWTARPRQPAQQDQPVRDQAPPSDLVSSGSPPQPDGAAAQMQKEIVGGSDCPLR